MKKIIYTLILLMIAASGLIFANREIKNKSPKKVISKPLSEAEKKAIKEKWYASPDGIKFKNWKSSKEGKKVLTSTDKISKNISTYSNMEAVVSSLTLPPGSRLGYGVMIKINNEDYILSFGVLKSNEFQQLQSLKVNEKIIIRSHGVSYAPKYLYPIIGGDYVERDGKIIYKSIPRIGGC